MFKIINNANEILKKGLGGLGGLGNSSDFQSREQSRTWDEIDKKYENFRNLYGIKITYIKTEKINQDEIFGEYTHIKSLESNISLEIDVSILLI